MKKLIALLLTLIMVFTLAACNTPEPPETTPCDECVDADRNGKCDVCGGDVEIIEEKQGLKLSNAIVKQIREAESMKLSLLANVVMEDDVWYSDESNEAVNEKLYRENVIEFEIALTKAKVGYDMHIRGTMKERDTKDGEFVYDDHIAELYFVDGVLYEYDNISDVYVEGTRIDLAAVKQALDELAAGIDVSEEETKAALEKFGDAFIKTFSIKDYKGSYSIDLKDELNGLLGYLADLDLENDSVRTVLNDALALVDKELTVEKIVAELERIAGLTVNEALAELDAFLTENYETTLQGIIDSLVADEKVMELVEKAVTMMVAGDAEPNEEQQAEIADMLAQVKAFKIADLITEMEIGEIKLFDLVLSMAVPANGDIIIPEGEEMTPPTIADIVAQVNAMLDIKLGELEEMIGTPIFSMAKRLGSTTVIDALDAKLDFNFKNIFAIDTIDLAVNLGITSSDDSMIEGKVNTSSVSVALKFNISDISNEKLTIALPDGATVIPNIEGEFINDYYEYEHMLEIDYYEGSLHVFLDIAVEDVEYTIYANIDADECWDGVSIITLDGETIDVRDYEDNRYRAQGDLVIKLDIDAEMYEIVSMPELSPIIEELPEEAA